MQSTYNFSFIIASTNNAFLRPAGCVCRLSFVVDFSTGVCYQSIMESDTEQDSSRRPAVIFAVLALWGILKWMFEFGMAHRPRRGKSGVFVPLIFMLKWLQFNLTSPDYPKMTAVFSGVCLLLLLLTYVFSSEIETLILLYPVD